MRSASSPTIICEWGLEGIAAHRAVASVFVIVDVLSFSTAVSVAIERGATVVPFPYGDPAAAAAEAARLGAVAASPRAAGGRQLSLSPLSLRRLEPATRILLPSPNGSRLSLATGDTPTIAGCLRNATAVARRAKEIAGDGVIGVIPAGERWADQSLRPAIEDWLGAGAIICTLDGKRTAEAELAAQTYLAVKEHVPELIRESRSGRELIDGGYCGDVEVALEAEATRTVPVMQCGEYQG